MCRLVAWTSLRPLTAREALGEEGVDALHRLSALHADGWGLATGQPEGPLVTRSTRRADLDEAFALACSEQASRLGLLHLRWATPGLPVQLANTHPFRDGEHAFAHNGAIYPTERLEEILAPSARARMGGSTDSERYFLAVLDAAERGVALPDAFAAVTQRLARDFSPSSLNAVLTSADTLYAVSCHDPAAAPNFGATVSADADADDLAEAPYFDLFYRVLPGAVVVASSGIAPEDSVDWQLLPNDSVLVVDRGDLSVRTHALGSGLADRASSAVALPTR